MDELPICQKLLKGDPHLGAVCEQAAALILAQHEALGECLEQLQAAINERYSVDIQRARDIARAALKQAREA